MNVLAFFAHPDDETMLAGGTLALLAERGAQVHYLCATRGEGGELGEPPLSKREELGERREQELVCAVQALGGRSLTFLGYEDPLMAEDGELYSYTDNLTMLAGQLAVSIDQHRPVAVFTHGSNGEYGHPAHVTTYQAAYIAIRSLGGATPALYTVSSIFPGHPVPRLANLDDTAHLVLDISPALEQKTEAAQCHKTQHALFVRSASEESGRKMSVPEVISFLKLEGIHRARPPLYGSEPDDAVANLLRPYSITPGE